MALNADGSIPSDPVTVTELPAAIAVTITGEIDVASATAIRTDVLTVVADARQRHVVLDLLDVDFFGSAGVPLLLEANTLARRRGIEFSVVVGEESRLARTLQIMGVDRALTIYPTRAAALR